MVPISMDEKRQKALERLSEDTLRSEVLFLLVDAHPEIVKREDLVKRLNSSRSSIKWALRELQEDGLVERVSFGRYKSCISTLDIIAGILVRLSSIEAALERN